MNRGAAPRPGDGPGVASRNDSLPTLTIPLSTLIADAVNTAALPPSNGSAYAGDCPHEAWLTEPMLTSVIVRPDTILKY